MPSSNGGGRGSKRSRGADGTAKEIAQAAFRKASKVERENRPEHKHVDVFGTVAPGVTSLTASVSHLSKTAQGVQSQERIGFSISPYKITGKLAMSSQYLIGTGERHAIRVVLVQDTQQVTDTLPTWADVFRDSSLLAHLNTDKLGRFTVLYDKVINQNNNGHDVQTYFNMSKKLTGKIRYNGTGTDDIQKMGIYLLILGDNLDLPTIFFRFRMSYTDE